MDNWVTEKYDNMTFVFAIDPVRVISSNALKTLDVSPGLTSFSVETPG